MKKTIALFFVFNVFALPVFAQREMPEVKELTGNVKYACEAILCLSTGSKPNECAPSIKKFFSIWDKKPWKIPEKRFNFLALCPVGSASVNSSSLGASRAEMVEYMNILAHGATACSANHLNKTNYRWVTLESCSWNQGHESYSCRTYRAKQIQQTLPKICNIYKNHRFTDESLLNSLNFIKTEYKQGYQFGYWTDDLTELDNSKNSDD